jgi:hypothetical protein
MARKFDVQYVHFYTDGSAARKLASAEPMETVRLPKAKKKNRIVIAIDPVATAGILMAVMMLVLLSVGVVQLRTARQNATRMAAYVDTLQTENTLLHSTYEASYDIENVEKTALALGLVPREQVTQVRMQMPAAQEENFGAWERFRTFLTGLFA